MQSTSQALHDHAHTHNGQIDPHAEKAMNWYGWGSPIGAGLFLVAVGACAALLHLAGLWH